MKKWIILLFIVCFSAAAHSSHITGGEMFYTFTGITNGLYQYTVTLKLYQRCNSGRQFPNPAAISIFDKTTNSRFSDLYINISQTENISINTPDPCITNPPTVCYDIAYYTFTVNLPPTSKGFVISSQVNYRINGITNLTGGQIGAIYTADIPGVISTANGPENNSARFTGSDLVVVCANNAFTYSFAAEDMDGNQLRYSFCGAYASTTDGGGIAVPTDPPPFPQVPYSPAFSASAPLGNLVHINSSTGLITGVAPQIGTYVVTVCVEEIRSGTVIATQRKDLQIHIADCNVASASLLPEYLLCDTTRNITFNNQSSSPLIETHYWEIANNNGSILSSGSSAFITHSFADTGIYKVKLVINRNHPCTDSTTSLVRVYPGFKPGFSVKGICVKKPSLFSDQTTSIYGTVDSWSWDFGDPSVTTDVSSIKNPVYTYSAIGPMNISLIATDSKGCRDTISKTITIIDKPPISLAFRDTLICVNDKLQLQASGSGNFSWSPLINISNSSTPSPLVSPQSTTTYYVELNDNGCINKDSVRVHVVDHVNLHTMNDTTICSGDTIQLRVISDGLQYRWMPTNQMIDATAKNPTVITNNTTEYTVTAIIGGCSASEKIVVTTIPYPQANAGFDTIVCFNTPAQLRGSTDGKTWSWWPGNSLSNPKDLHPVARPAKTTFYVFSAFDTRGCPKPGRDTILVTVLPRMNVSAGRDTAVLIRQPLELQATGGEFYEWSPAENLSATNIPNPVAIFTEPSTGLTYKLVAFNSAGCSDSTLITIKVFATGPSVFIPSAFTPNNDGKNDVLRPIAVGMKKIEYFQVFSRWGQLVFTTSVNGQGWDGKINGREQATNTYVWMVKAIDLNGKPYFSKGTVTLIR